MGTHLKVFREGYPKNTNTAGLRCFFKNRCVLVLSTKVASALEESRGKSVCLEVVIELVHRLPQSVHAGFEPK